MLISKASGGKMSTVKTFKEPTPLTLGQALDACVGYARHRSHFDRQQKRFVQDAHEGRPTDLPLEEQHELIGFVAQGDEEKYEKLSLAHKQERLSQALKDGRIRAWGHLAPFKQHDKKQLIDAGQWHYLNIGEDVATGEGQTYTDLQFETVPDTITATAARNAASRNTRDEIIAIYEDNITELRPLTHDQRGERIRQIAEQNGFETVRGYGESNIRRVLSESKYPQKPTN